MTNAPPWENNPFRNKRKVENSTELQRIFALPQRSWQEDYPDTGKLDPHIRSYAYRVIYHGWHNQIPDPQVDAHLLGYYPDLAKYLRTLRIEAFCRQPHGQQTLRPVQAAALYEMWMNKGLLLSAGIGHGKTLVSLLGFLMMQSVRPILLLPAALVEKTRIEMDKYRQHWNVPGYIRILSYEWLSRPDQADALDQAMPDVIIADEVQKLRNSDTVLYKRMRRFLLQHEGTSFIGMSGTIMKDSIKDFAHLLDWALRGRNGEPSRSPMPTTFEHKETWSMALDHLREGQTRLAPGALVEFCTPEERHTIEKLSYDEGVGVVRRAVLRRMAATPGMVATTDAGVSASLRVQNVIVRLDAIDIANAVDKLRRWRRPDNEIILDGIEQWRHMRSVALGFFYRWNPQPPEEWRQARAEFGTFIREILKNNRSGIDSEALAVKAIEELRYDRQKLDRWLAVKDKFDPEANKQAVWIDHTAVKWCAQWLRKEASGVPKDEQGGICWVEQIEFGQVLSAYSGIVYYGAEGYDPTGKFFIERHPPGEPMIVGIAANMAGRNLQAWSKNLISCPPQNGAAWEQMLGRTHRSGQEADEVTAHVFTPVPEMLASFEEACRQAKTLSDMTGQPQKLTYCDIVIHPFGGPAPTKKRAQK